MADMLVPLRDLSPSPYVRRGLVTGTSFRRAEPGDRMPLRTFVESEFGARWADGIDICLARVPIAVFVAQDGELFVGFALYDCTYLGSFGPIGVRPDHRNRGIGATLLHLSLVDMQTKGYAYCAIIDIGPAQFYEKACGASLIT